MTKNSFEAEVTFKLINLRREKWNINYFDKLSARYTTVFPGALECYLDIQKQVHCATVLHLLIL